MAKFKFTAFLEGAKSLGAAQFMEEIKMGAVKSKNAVEPEVLAQCEEKLWEIFSNLEVKSAKEDVITHFELSELNVLANNPFLKHICRIFSKDGSGELTFPNFVDLASAFSPHAPQEIKILLAFNIFDLNHDGTLSHHDLEKTLGIMTTVSTDNKAKDFLDIQEAVELVMNEADIDGDDGVSEKEFEQMVSRIPDFHLITHCFQTLTRIFQALFQRREAWSNFTVDILSVTCSVDNSEIFFKLLFDSISALLMTPEKTKEILYLKEAASEFLVCMCCAVDNVTSNAFLEFFMMHDLFSPLIKGCCASYCTANTARNTNICLSILCLNNNQQQTNNYLENLANLDDPQILDTLVFNFEQTISTYGSDVESSVIQEHGVTGWMMWAVQRVWGSDTIGSWPEMPTLPTYPAASIILLHLLLSSNSFFISRLTQQLAQSQYVLLKKKETDSQTSSESSSHNSSPSSSSPVSNSPYHSPRFESMNHQTLNPSLGNRAVPELISTVIHLSSALLTTRRLQRLRINEKGGDRSSYLILHMGNLLTHTFYSLLQNKTWSRFIFDSSVMVSSVEIFHRNPGAVAAAFSKSKLNPSNEPLAVALFRIFSSVLLSSSGSSFCLSSDSDIIIQCIEGLHGLATACRDLSIRMTESMRWTFVWESLLKILELSSSSSSSSSNSHSVPQSVTLAALRLINMGICFGQEFLPTDDAYDEIFHEVIRKIPQMLTFGKWARNSSMNRKRETQAQIGNLLRISEHFDAVVKYRNLNSAEDVRSIIREGYDSLELQMISEVSHPYNWSENGNSPSSEAKASSEKVSVPLRRLFIQNCFKQILEE